MIPRLDRKRILSAGIPGIVAFDHTPLIVPYSGRLKRLRLSLNEKHPLHLGGLKLAGDGEIDYRKAEFQMSSRHPSFQPPDALVNGGLIHTMTEDNPFWEMRLHQAYEISSIAIGNRQGPYAFRAFGLCVEMEDENGRVIQFDNLGEEIILERMKAFQESLEILDTAMEPAGRLVSSILLFGDVRDMLSGNLPLGEPKLTALRYEALLEIVEAAERIKITEAATLLPVFEGVIDKLIWRGVEAKKNTEAGPETQALALKFASQIINDSKKIVSNKSMTGYLRLFSSPAQIEFIETKVSSYYERFTGDTKPLPFMIRTHGISGSTLRNEAEQYLNAMDEVKQALSALS